MPFSGQFHRLSYMVTQCQLLPPTAVVCVPQVPSEATDETELATELTQPRGRLHSEWRCLESSLQIFNDSMDKEKQSSK